MDEYADADRPGDDELVKFEACNEHACAGSPQGEAGAAVMSLGGGGGQKTVTLNVHAPQPTCRQESAMEGG